MSPQGDKPAGLVLVDKPSDWTSHDVVGRVRRLAGTRRVGHAGTLDPLATGLLLVGVNRATRLLGHLAGADKTYLAEVCLGISTHSDDAQGDETGRADASGLTAETVAAAMTAFVGDIAQVPSSVSAIKVDGRRAHARVRAGEEVTLAARPVHVESFDLIEFMPGETAAARISVTCSSGTYVRALARDLGAMLGVGGHVTSLRRTRVGAFGIEEAHTLDALAEDWSAMPLDEVARRTFTTITLDAAEAADVRFGRPLPSRSFGDAAPGAVFGPDGEFLALYKNDDAGIVPVAVFV